MFDVFKILMFTFANGDRITDITVECVEKVKEFVDELIADYKEGQIAPMNGQFYESVAIKYAEKYPEIAEQSNKATQDGTVGTATIGPQSAFADLIRLVLENKDDIVQLIQFLIAISKGFSGQDRPAE